jgi:putative ABC transport system permease protein
VRALDRKLLRDLWRLKGQMLSIAMVVGAGVMTVVTLRGSYESLADSLDRYYRENRFAEVFAELERAPERVALQIAMLPGVAAVQTRVMQMVNLDVPGLPEAAVGQMLSIPPRPEPTLNAIHIVQGRYIDPSRPDEVLVSESFANANALGPGSQLGAVINGRWRRLEVVGIAISPDFIGEIAPGTILPDDRRFGILRMNRDVLAAAAGLRGSFNEISLTLAPGASEAAVIAAVDVLLEPYGGRGAYGRRNQQSHETVTGELKQNRTTGTFIPAIFLGVAAFLLNIVLSRLVGTQRDQIAVLKAFGYSNTDVGRHYLRFALASVVSGALIGTAVGIYFGGALTGVYGQFFRFPDLQYEVSWRLIAIAAGISMAAAALGALGAVRKAVRLPPAEAMRPEAPVRFRPGPLERIGLGSWLPASGRMIIRNVERQPARSIMSAVGVALSVAILVISMFFFDAVQHMVDVQFRQIQREDLAVHFTGPRPLRVRHELAQLHGVTTVEPFRAVPVRLSFGHASRSTVVTGVPHNAQLRRVVDRLQGPIALPHSGIVLNSKLAEILGVVVGDSVDARVLEGRRSERRIAVAGLVEEIFGIGSYMDYSALHQLLREAPAASGAYLRVEPASLATLTEELKEIPAVVGVYAPASLRQSFEQQLAENLLVSITFLVVLAGILAVGVIYNGARIALSERGRELASLRVLGFSRREVSVLLLGEQGSITLLAIPLGWAIGFGLGALLLSTLDMETFRIPMVVSERTYLFSGLVTLASSILAGLAVRRRLNELDLIEVLKTRE